MHQRSDALWASEGQNGLVKVGTEDNGMPLAIAEKRDSDSPIAFQKSLNDGTHR
jgi:hypothetical protein